MAAQLDLKPYMELLSREIGVVVNTVREKGAKRFGRAFGAAGFMVFAAYMGVYRPPQAKSARLSAEIAHAKMMADYGAQYATLRDELAAAYRLLPRVEDRDQWLSNSVRDSLNVGGLITEDFKPVREQELNGLVFQTSAVTVTVRFADLYDWILRLESAKPMMHLQTLDLSKKTDKMGYNSASCEISTVIPLKRYR